MKILSILFATSAVVAGLGPYSARKQSPKQFAIFFSEPSKSFADRTNQNAVQYWKSWTAYIGEIQKSGKLDSGSALTNPSEGVRIDKSGRATAAQNGTALSGYLIIRAESLDEAVAVAGKSPAIAEGGNVQVRPILPMEQHGAGN